LEIHLGEPKLFSEEEASCGISYSRSKFKFEVDKNFLLQTANDVLKQIKRDPSLKFKGILKESLRGVRFEERCAYIAAIGKMFSNRSMVHRLSRHHKPEKT